MAYLGQRLLSGFTAVVFVSLALITLRDANVIGWGWLLTRIFVLLVMAAATAVIVMRARWRQRPLRVVEAVVFVTLSLYLVARTYAVGVVDPAAAAAVWTSTVAGIGFLMISYGLFVVN